MIISVSLAFMFMSDKDTGVFVEEVFKRWKRNKHMQR